MSEAVVLAVTAAGLLAMALATRRPPAVLLGRTAARAAWSAGHGARVSSLTASWLGVGHGLARPLARWGVSPDVVTLASVWWCGLALVTPPPVAFVAVLVAAVCDVLDGALATGTGRATPLGAVLDGVADRVCDVLLLLVLHRLGADGRACVAAGVLLFVLEDGRSRAQVAGMAGAGAVTTGERPVRVSLVLGALLTAAVLPSWTVRAAQVAAGAQVGLTAVGVVVLGRAVVRALGRAPAS